MKPSAKAMIKAANKMIRNRITTFDDMRQIIIAYVKLHGRQAFMWQHLCIVAQGIEQGGALSGNGIGDPVRQISPSLRPPQVPTVNKAHQQIGTHKEYDKAEDRSVFLEQGLQKLRFNTKI